MNRDPKEEELRQLRAAADAAWRATPRLMMVGRGKRRERNERLALEALEASEAAYRAMLGPVEPGPGDR